MSKYPESTDAPIKIHPTFGFKSKERLQQCHPNLQKIALEMIKEMDITILCGHRNEADQNQAFISGHSKLQWPRSKHNKTPSLAVDIAPYPVDWHDIARFDKMCDLAQEVADRLNIKIRLGRSFSFRDYPHIELA